MKLYIIATPIGNLKEISLRSLEIIKNVDYIAAEDTRVSIKILLNYKIKKKLISCHEHNEKKASDKIIELIKKGYSIAYMCDAGTPCVSDPGKKLIKKCIENNIKIIPISGPSALLNIYVASGFEINHFYFYGFLSNKQNNRKKELKKISSIKEPIIFYESPHRIKKTLEDILEIFGNKNICIGHEMTKIHEEFIRGKIKEVKDKLDQKKIIKGEFSFIIDNSEEKNKKNKILNKNEILEEMKKLSKNGLKTKEIVKKISFSYNIPKNKIYEMYIKNK